MSSKDSDQPAHQHSLISLHRISEDCFSAELPIQHQMKTLIGLHSCISWFESSQGTHDCAGFVVLWLKYYHKNINTTETLQLLSENLNSVVSLRSIYKQCRMIGKQYRLRSDCSLAVWSGSTLFAPDLFVWKLRIVTVWLLLLTFLMKTSLLYDDFLIASSVRSPSSLQPICWNRTQSRSTSAILTARKQLEMIRKMTKPTK